MLPDISLIALAGMRFQVITSRCCYHSMSTVQSGLQLGIVSVVIYSLGVAAERNKEYRDLNCEIVRWSVLNNQQELSQLSTNRFAVSLSANAEFYRVALYQSFH